MVSPASAAPPTITSLYPAGARRGTTVEVAAVGTLDPWPVKVWAGGTGVSVVPAKEKGKLAVTVAKDAAPGVYWLRAHNDEGAGGLRPFVVGTLPEVAEKEPNDDARKAQAVEGNAVVNGRLEKAGDVDCFAVALKKGQTLVAAIEANHTLRSPMDAILQVVSADGFVLNENHDFRGLDPQLAFTAPKDGTYVVRVFAFPAQPDSSIRFFGSEACVYRLTLTTGPFADFAVPAGDGAVIHGWNIPKAGLRVPVPKPAAGESHVTLWAPELANMVRMPVGPHPARVELDGPAAVAKYELPFTLFARLDAKGAARRVPVTLKKGQAVSIAAESRGPGLPVNPVVEVFDAEGKRLSHTEPAKLNGDTATSFTPAADGVFTIAVSDLYAAGGSPRDVFVLRVAPPEPDYELAVTADRFALAPGKPTTIPVKVTRRGGFAKPVEVVAEGLPAGVKFEVVQPAKPDPNAVTVTLTAEKPVSGAFRLVGRVKDEPGLTHLARAPLMEFEDSTADLWLAPAGAAAKKP